MFFIIKTTNYVSTRFFKLQLAASLLNVSLDHEAFIYTYIFLFASSECPDGTFGADCGSMCHCADAVPCDKVTGECPDGCAPGWVTLECDEGE